MRNIHCILLIALICAGCTTSSVPDGVVVVSEASHDDFVIRSTKPVVLEFWVSWCGPCKAMKPIISKIAAETPDVAFGKVNIDEEPALAQRYSVQAIPTVVLIVSGKVRDQKVGLLPEQALRELIRTGMRAN